LVEGIVDFLKNAVGVIYIFFESARALISEPKEFVDITIFVVASQQNNLARELQFEGEQ
jgi:hypothetical protein